MNDLVGLLVVIMVVCFGQALLYSEASLPVGIAWIFSCRQTLTTAALHIHPHQWSSSVHRLYALDSTHIAPVRIQKMDDSVRYCRHLQNHATLTYINSESACLPACLPIPRKPEHQLLVSFRCLLLSSFWGSHMCNVRHQKPQNFCPTQITFCPLQICLTRHSVFFQA